MFKIIVSLFLLSQLSTKAIGIETLSDFLVTAYDERFKVISPEKFKPNMEIVIENKTLVRLIGKITLNNRTVLEHVSIDSEKYKKINIKLKKGDILNFVPLSPAFQEIELVVGNKTYEIPERN